MLATNFLLQAQRSGWLQQPLGSCWDDWFPCSAKAALGQGSDVSQHQCTLVSMHHLHLGCVLGPGCNHRGCPDRGLPRGQASDRSMVVPPSLCS